MSSVVAAFRRAGRRYRRTTVYRALQSLQLDRPAILYPMAFVAGVALEYVKIFWRPAGVNFYDTWSRRRMQLALEDYERQLARNDAILEMQRVDGAQAAFWPDAKAP